MNRLRVNLMLIASGANMIATLDAAQDGDAWLAASCGVLAVVCLWFGNNVLTERDRP